VLGIAGALAIALLILLFPPWQARAIRTSTRYGAVSGVAPATLTDTVRWTLTFAPLYSPPRATLGGERMQELATRSLAGDNAAKTELSQLADKFEIRFHVPEVLRVSGSLWRDSVLAKAGIPSVTSYDLTFAIHQRWLAARLAVVAAIGLLATRRRAKRRGGVGLPA